MNWTREIHKHTINLKIKKKKEEKYRGVRTVRNTRDIWCSEAAKQKNNTVFPFSVSVCRKQQHLQDNAQQQPRCWLPSEFSKSAQKIHPTIEKTHTNELQPDSKGNASYSTSFSRRLSSLNVPHSPPEGSRMLLEEWTAKGKREGKREQGGREWK